jgi:CheY-like chemotaxis protein
MGKMPLGDPTRLRQVLINLLSNAVKFTNAGMVKLQAAINGKTDKTITMHFEVKYSGIGMTEEQIEKIFDPFTQAESGTTRKYGGTGLGLAITKSIIEMMGGKLFVESTPKVGSKFSFDLVFDTVDVPEEIKLEKASALEEIEKPVFEGEVLLCEDNAMNQRVICEHLSRVGLKTVVADNGKIGVDMVRGRALSGQKQFDLVFMDMHMPVMDGLEASAKILELNTGVSVIAMTANVMSNDLDIYRNSGMNDCVGKPFTSQELWRCLLKYLKPVSGGNVTEKKPGRDMSSETDPFELDAEFTRSLKRTFVKSNREKFEEIEKALDDRDIKLAHRLAHTLKSNAGQIGLDELQKAAADVENLLKDGGNHVTKEQLALLDSALKAALSDLASQIAPFDEQPAESQKTELDTGGADKLFEKLEDLLKRGNPECGDLIDELRAIPESGHLVQHIKDFEFEKALLEYGELKKKYFETQGK